MVAIRNDMSFKATTEKYMNIHWRASQNMLVANKSNEKKKQKFQFHDFAFVSTEYASIFITSRAFYVFDFTPNILNLSHFKAELNYLENSKHF